MAIKPSEHLHSWARTVVTACVTMVLAWVVFQQTAANQTANEMLQEAQQMPYLVIESISGETPGLQLTNDGVGPAIIDRLIFRKDGKTIAELFPGYDVRSVSPLNPVSDALEETLHWSELRKIIPIDAVPLTQIYDIPRPSNAIAPGASRVLIAIKNFDDAVSYARKNDVLTDLQGWLSSNESSIIDIVVQYHSVSARTCRVVDLFGRSSTCDKSSDLFGN